MAVLAALLSPAVQSTRAKGRDAACIANLRTLGAGMALLLQDHNGTFPLSQDSSPTWGTGVNAILACGLMAEYANVPKGGNPTAGRVACPAAKYPGYNPTTNPRVYNISQLGYGVNPAVCPWIGDPSQPAVGHAKLVNIRRPSEVIVLGDAGQQANGNAPFFIIWSGKFDLMRALSRGNPATADQPIDASYFELSWMPETLLPVSRHHGKAHFLFADGHVQALEKEELREKNIYWNY